jgi:hypothetical protein
VNNPEETENRASLRLIGTEKALESAVSGITRQQDWLKAQPGRRFGFGTRATGSILTIRYI